MIRIITDSLCDLTMDYAKELNIDIMPLTVRFGEDDFKCGIDLTNEAFYDKLTNDSNNPSTAAVNPFEFEEIFKKYIDAGDEVVAVLFSKYMSATFQSASIAAENINSDRLYLIDCETGAMGQGLLVETAVTLRDEGKSANAWLINKLKDQPADENYKLVIGHSNAPERAKAFEEQLREAGIKNEILTTCIGPVVGTHIGPNCLGIGYIIK